MLSLQSHAGSQGLLKDPTARNILVFEDDMGDDYENAEDLNERWVRI